VSARAQVKSPMQLRPSARRYRLPEQQGAPPACFQKKHQTLPKCVDRQRRTARTGIGTSPIECRRTDSERKSSSGEPHRVSGVDSSRRKFGKSASSDSLPCLDLLHSAGFAKGEAGGSESDVEKTETAKQRLSTFSDEERKKVKKEGIRNMKSRPFH